MDKKLSRITPTELIHLSDRGQQTELPTTTELRAVFNDTPALRFLSISFERAIAMRHVRWAMERRALQRRQPHTTPIQPTLI